MGRLLHRVYYVTSRNYSECIQNKFLCSENILRRKEKDFTTLSSIKSWQGEPTVLDEFVVSKSGKLQQTSEATLEK